MSLSLAMKDNTRRLNVGSYGHIHYLRLQAIACFALAMKRQQRDDLYERALNMLCPVHVDLDCLEEAEAIKALETEVIGADIPQASRWIDYAFFAEDNPTSRIGKADENDVAFAGLEKFVDHSDCDGGHTPGDAWDILKMLRVVLRELAPRREASASNAELFADLKGLCEYFRSACMLDHYVIYC